MGVWCGRSKQWLVCDAGSGARIWRVAETGLEAATHDRLLQLGRGGVWTRRFHRVGRRNGRGAENESRRLSESRCGCFGRALRRFVSAVALETDARSDARRE